MQPGEAELSACLEALAAMQLELAAAGHAGPSRRAREILVHALLNHNDFITIR